MYPIFRMAKEVIKNRNAEPLPLLGVHVSHHRCWPWDLDFWMELNNGRTLTIYDLGRIPLSMRMGLASALQKNKWGMTIAGSSVRYRKRVRMFDRVEIRSRAVGWDDRFIYLVQSMWRDGDCTSQALYRSAVTDKNGIVAPTRVLAALNAEMQSPELPDWVKNWIAAEDSRIWPPEM
ncbi:acyl-CoA thioesterase [Cochlodiniinecator piscidefendens]|uniref:acyl-CoA thioesterase n=1 Tax=Cochlodiniinecator piscidefendens TaxID=2715756 RepID=UPI00140A8653|nr:acyl-CoA thioesterase [Cochlodiniinecator piscidefendens]